MPEIKIVYSVILQITTMFKYVFLEVEKDEMTLGAYRTQFFKMNFL